MQYPYHDNPAQSSQSQSPTTVVPPPPGRSGRDHNVSRIGMPILFASGPYAGQTIRFAKRDRRPLDPPPVVQLRMYQVFNADTDHPTEQEIPPEQVEVGGLVCHVDLFTIRPQALPTLRVVGSGDSSPSSSSTSTTPTTANFSQMVTPIPPPEDAKVTDSLFGTTFSVASQIKGLDGVEVLFYVFSDLSVRTEGIMFDIFSRMEGSEDIPVLAECHGGPFAIYSTKEFPGLRASTELTKHLSRYGIRVNLREAERKRKPVEPLMPPPAVPSTSPMVPVAAPAAPASVILPTLVETVQVPASVNTAPPPTQNTPTMEIDEQGQETIRQAAVSSQPVESDTENEVT
ncbi:hypothetical protein Clacol_009073 [Clathrus columnatus]|uniref:Velvet domain-containing protein n=1 Tax=Clathrus columnatus TaxID=1419009 RepID=A0AAV5AK86_9AGAM|nr:hypothetical protein Clacol_009073 [Clathrus columnatus]